MGKDVYGSEDNVDHQAQMKDVLADARQDREEIRLLRSVAEKASDYTFGLGNDEFASLNGGRDALLHELHVALNEWYEWSDESAE